MTLLKDHLWKGLTSVDAKSLNFWRAPTFCILGYPSQNSQKKIVNSMKFIAALTLALASSASAFSPAASAKKATSLNVGPLDWETVGYEFADDKWQYRPWSGIGETEFYPMSHAGNRMHTFFPPPTQTLGAKPPTPYDIPNALPAAAQAAPMPEAQVPASMPAQA